MARKLDGSYITANTITTTQLTTTVVSQISAGGGPKVTTITYPNSATATVNTGNESIVLTGTGFDAGVQIYVNGAAVPSVSRTNSTSLSFTTPALSTGTTYPLYVVNPDGGTAVVVPGMVVSAGPVWVTESPLTSWGASSALSRSLVATSDSTVSYALQDGSSLPSGLSLAANGLLSGTLTSPPGVETTYNFTVTATDLELQKSSKAFSINASSGNLSFSITPSVNGKSTWDPSIDGELTLTSNGTWTISTSSDLTANIIMWGAGGGGATGSGDSSTVPHRNMRGGGGGCAKGLVTLTSGVSYTIRVGEGGRGANQATVLFGGGVAGGGGAITDDGNWGCGGGGAYTGIFRGTETHANSVLIAGGGGGAGLHRNSGPSVICVGGAGGGANGENGTWNGSNTSVYAGTGGTQNAGGYLPNPNSFDTPGGALTGGYGTSAAPNDALVSGGGGSGYYGGGAGQNSGDIIGGGGGGSGYAHPTYTSQTTLYTGYQFNPGNNTDSRCANAGIGGTGASYSVVNSTYGGNGKFVLISTISS
jgi:hypothetical protein